MIMSRDLCRRRRCTCPPVASLPRGGHPYGQHLHGCCPCRRCRYWRPPLQAAALAGAEPVVDHPLWASRGRPFTNRWQQPLRYGRERAPPPCGLALAAAAAPLHGGLGCNRPSLQGGWPWPCPAAPCKGFLRCENLARTRRTIIRDSISSNEV
ncbi:hypothetical protein BHM03_00048110 [Ensete ventricosum]|nr:hypothetical protein BHM03_00048110 [Ensete ventricosum]